MVLAAKDRATYIQIHMIDFVLAVEQRIEEDVISCLKNGTHIKIGDDNDRDVDDCVLI